MLSRKVKSRGGATNSATRRFLYHPSRLIAGQLQSLILQAHWPLSESDGQWLSPAAKVALFWPPLTDVVIQRLREWSAARQTDEPNEWSSEQWPEDVRKQADDFADRLRANALVPPVVYYAEWSDMWSMGDLFGRWLTPSDDLMPLAIYADQYEIFGYALPDGGSLSRHLASSGPQQWDESDWFVGRLREAVGAWEELIERRPGAIRPNRQSQQL